MFKAAVVITNGSEELEAVTIIDILRRSKNIEASLVVLGESTLHVECSRHVTIIGDVLFRDYDWETADAIILPGGMIGARTFESSKVLHAVIQALWGKGKVVAAICASVVALKASGIGKGLRATSHPCVKAEVDNHFTFDDISDVVQAFNSSHSSAQLVTSRGPGTALRFALSLIAVFVGSEEAKSLESSLMMPQ